MTSRLRNGVLSLSVAAVLVSLLGAASQEHDERTPPPADAAEGRRPWRSARAPRSIAWSGYFEPNVGQFDEDVRFTFTGRSTCAVFLDDGVLVAPGTGGAGPGGGPAALRIEFVGRERAAPELVGEDATGPRISYLLGRRPRADLAGIQTFERVRERDVYDGVDVVWRASDDTLEYLIEASNALALGQVRVQLRGARELRVTSSGELSFRTWAGEVRQSPPLAFVADDGSPPLECRYRVVAEDEFVFDVTGAGDQRVVVDPVLRFSTLMRGADARVRAVQTDVAGALFFAGKTSGSALRILGGRERTGQRGHGDVVVGKIDSRRARLEFVTFIGGRKSDSGNDLAIGADGSVFVVGSTESADFPLENAAEGTPPVLATFGFVTQLAPGGSQIVFSTYLRGATWNTAASVALEANGDCIVVGRRTGRSSSGEGGGLGDIRVVRFERGSGRIKRSTQIGGDDDDVPLGVAVGPDGVAYVVGWTRSADFPVSLGRELQGDEDGFVLALDPDGNTVFARLIGGAGYDALRSCAVDADGLLHVAGRTSSRDLATRRATQGSYGGGAWDALVGGIDAAGEVRYLTYLGGHDQDSASDIAVDADGAVYVCGWTVSADFPSILSFQPEETTTAFVVQFLPGGTLGYAAKFGGTRGHALPSGIAVIDGARVAVCGVSEVRGFPLASSVGRAKPRDRALRPFLMVIDGSAPPETAHLKLRAGKLRSRDAVVSGLLRGTLRPVLGLSDGALDPATEPLEVEFVAGDGQVLLTVEALDPRWKARRRGVMRWKGTFAGGGTGTVKVNTRTFRFSVSFDDAPVSGPLADVVRVRVRIGDDESTHRSAWALRGTQLRFGRR